MCKNLGTIQFQNGDLITIVTSGEEWERVGIEGKPACCYYNNNPENDTTPEVIYNWSAVNDPRGIAPEGWRIPKRADWEELINYLGGKNVAGKKMKSTDGWLPVKNRDGNGSNESGFNAYPTGFRNFIGAYYNKGLSCCWWCLKDTKNQDNLFYYVVSERDHIDCGVFDIEDGLSVRCIKN